MRNVTLKQLRTFAAVVRNGTMVSAAQQLSVTPPAVTIQMRLLEESIGMPLIERSADGVRPTAAGREVLTLAARIDQLMAECAHEIGALRGLEGGEVHVGVVSTAKYFAPRALAAFARSHPKVELKLVIGNREDIVAALSEYRVDFVIMGRSPEHLDCEQDLIGDNPHIIIAPPGHPLARRTAIPLAAFADELFLVREKGSGTRNLMERHFGQAGLELRIGMEIASNETIKQAVMAGLGIAFLSAHTVASELGDGRLVALDAEGLPLLRTWYLVKHRERRLLPAAKALREFLAEQGGRYLPQVPQAAAPAADPAAPPKRARRGRSSRAGA